MLNIYVIDSAYFDRGNWCDKGIRRPCAAGYYGDAYGLTSPTCTAPCPLGYYCHQQSTLDTIKLCPAGRYGNSTGLSDSSCSGSCNAGYYCPLGSVSAEEYPCAGIIQVSSILMANVVTSYGIDFSVNQPTPFQIPSNLLTAVIADLLMVAVNSPMEISRHRGAYLKELYDHLVDDAGKCNYNISIGVNSSDSMIYLSTPNTVFCPAGSFQSLTALPGYYTVGNTKYKRFSQIVCPLGSYCMSGVRLGCDAGRFGNGMGLTSGLCSGICPRGYYCPPGTVNYYNNPCPAGRYGSTEGLTDSSCSGPCQHSYECPEASVYDHKLPNNLGNTAGIYTYL